ncbi:MAG: LuxR C-terminal-related transcriptional regulator [Ktedonobacteraceae bacterium]
MARSTTRVHNGLLEDPSMDAPVSIRVGSADWYDWVSRQRSFRFEQEGMRYTARREQRPGGWYWYASRRIHGTLHTVYLGRSEDLTLARLNLVAQQLGDIFMAKAGNGKAQYDAGLSNPLLMTRLSAPLPRPDLVLRPRLLARMQAESQGKLLLIVAPAGYGKTTLVSTWLASCGLPAAWTALEEDDNDPVRFWHYVVAALGTLGINQGKQLLPALHARQLPPMEVFLTALLNVLATRREHILLALDDYHVITNALIHKALQFLIEHLPPHVHLVLTSRTEPPLTLARMRVYGEVHDLTLSDLRFTGDEALAFFRQRMSLDLPVAQIDQLREHTEGWVAGLQLAALSLQQSNEPAAIITSSLVFNRYIFEYFTEEVFKRLPASTQDFLLLTSILSGLNGALCDAVTAQQGGAAMLVALEQGNLFVLSADAQRCWYRYHHLFADTLRHLLQQRYPERVASLHTRAALWYEGNGQTHEAINHALAASDVELAVRLIETFTASTGWYGGIVTRRAWLAALPAGIIRSRPRLSVLFALACMEQNLFAAAQPALLDAEAACSTIEEGEQLILRGEIAAIRSTIAINLGYMAGAIEPARQALQLLPRSDERFLATIGQVVLNLADTCSDDASKAQEMYAEAVSLNRAAGNFATAITAMSGSGAIYTLRGRLQEAEQILIQALALGRETLLPWPSTGKAHIQLGAVYYEWNRLSEALHHVHEGIQYCQQWGHIYHQGEGLLLQAQIQAAQGDVAAGVATLEYGRHLVDKATLGAPGPLSIPRLRELSTRFIAQKVDFLLLQGDIEGAMHSARQCGLSLTVFPGQMPTRHDAILAHLLLALGKIAAARSLLAINSSSLTSDNNAGWTSSVIKALLMRTVVLAASGAREPALLELERALKLAEPGGHVRAFLDAGTSIERLLVMAIERGTAMAGYINLLLNAFKAEHSGRTRPGLTLADPLSERELAVLRLLAAGQSSADIAGQLVIGVNTVRTHIKHIYQKLDAHTRLEARERARLLKLV